ncbi:MAG: hypothetical protein WC716_11070 [Chitinophagaceae bacterium]|jgi:hypothetical protein
MITDIAVQTASAEKIVEIYPKVWRGFWGMLGGKLIEAITQSAAKY